MNELVLVGAVSPLRQRLVDDMTLRRFSRETQRNYLRAVGGFAAGSGARPIPRPPRMSASSRSSSRGQASRDRP